LLQNKSNIFVLTPILISMNKLIFFCIVSNFLLVAQSIGQICPPGNVTLSNQSEVDNFVAMYPNCTTINGNLFIGGASTTSNIDNISGLGSITSVSGNLNVNRTVLTSLDGFGALESINGRFTVFGSNLLTNLEGANNLESIGGDLWVDALSLLTSLEGLEGLKSIGGFLYLSNCGNLSSISALSNLESVGTRLSVRLLGSLHSFEGLEGLSSLGTEIIIVSSGFESLQGLENIATLSGKIEIRQNSNLVDITALNDIDHTGISQVIIQQNTDLSECSINSFCEYFNSVSSSSSIWGNAVGCNNQSEIESNCPKECGQGFQLFLRTQSEVDNFLTGVNTGCTIFNGTLSIEDDNDGNDNINSLLPLNGLEVFTGLSIVSNPDLISLEGLESVREVQNLFVIGNNSNLTSLSALLNLEHFGDYFTITDNIKLVNLAGLENVQSGFDVFVFGNSMLSDCCNVFHTFNNENISGFFFGNNDPLGMCNTIEDVFGRTFTGAEDQYFNKGSNWTVGCGTPVPTTGLLVIDNYCETIGTPVLNLSPKSKLTITPNGMLNHNDSKDFILEGNLSLLGELNVNSTFINNTYLTNYGILSGAGEYRGNINNRNLIKGSATYVGNINNSIGTIQIGD